MREVCLLQTNNRNGKLRTRHGIVPLARTPLEAYTRYASDRWKDPATLPGPQAKNLQTHLIVSIQTISNYESCMYMSSIEHGWYSLGLPRRNYFSYI